MNHSRYLLGQTEEEIVLNKIRQFLMNNKNELYGVRTIKKKKVDAIIDRFSEFSSLLWFLPDNYQQMTTRELFRTIALDSIIEFIRLYPFLDHTPNTLRSCFALPTRTDRKKGRYSRINLRNKAINKGLQPRYDELLTIKERLRDYLAKKESTSDRLTHLYYYLETIQDRQYGEEIAAKPISNHPQSHINQLRDFLISDGFVNVVEADEEDELSPDLIAEKDGKVFWIEYKDYRYFNMSMKIIFQLFKYLMKTKRVIIVSTTNLPILEELLSKESWSPDELYNWANSHVKSLRNESTKFKADFSLFKEVRPIIDDDNVKLETFMVSVITEMIINKLGRVGTETQELLKFIEKVLPEMKKPTAVYTYETFINNSNVIKEPFIVIKTDFKVKEENQSK